MKLINLITNYILESGYILKDDSDLITFKVEDKTLEMSETIFVNVFENPSQDDTLKRIIVFSGTGFVFNPLVETEKLKAISLLRSNATMHKIGYWGIDYSYGTYWGNYFVDLQEDCLNVETFKEAISAIFYAKKNLEKIIEKPFHIN